MCLDLVFPQCSQTAGVWLSWSVGALTAADGGINSLTYACAIDRAAWGGDHTTLICHTDLTIKGKL